MNKEENKGIKEIIKKFHQKYDFSENKTLEYDNLVGIADFIEQSFHTFIQNEIERLSGERKNYEGKSWNDCKSQEEFVGMTEKYSFNTAIDQQITHYTSLQESLNK
jgi:hypothetical protein